LDYFADGVAGLNCHSESAKRAAREQSVTHFSFTAVPRAHALRRLGQRIFKPASR